MPDERKSSLGVLQAQNLCIVVTCVFVRDYDMSFSIIEFPGAFRSTSAVALTLDQGFVGLSFGELHAGAIFGHDSSLGHTHLD